MAWYWTLLEQSANLVEATMIVIFFSQFFEPRYPHRLLPAAYMAGVFIMINLSNIVGIPVELNLFVFVFIGILLCLLFFRGNLAAKLLIPLLMTALILIAEILAVGVVQLIFNDIGLDLQHETAPRMLGIIISKLALIILVFSVGRFSKKEQSRIPLFYSLCILTIPVVSAINMITIMQFVIKGANGSLSPAWMAFSALGLMLMSVLVIYLFQALVNYSRNQSRYELMSQQAEMLSKHLQERNALQEETHRIWHDMKNHFTVIQWMVKSRSFDKLEQYMLTLNETVSGSMFKIQSGNPILDALLNPKVTEAKRYGINFAVNAGVPSGISIEDIDINVVYSNAIDNAIEACRKLPQEKDRFIELDTYVRNDHLVLVIRNSFDGVLLKSGNGYRTTKDNADRHGIGMGNMKRVVEKYDGHIMTENDGNVFALTVAMYCKVSMEQAG